MKWSVLELNKYKEEPLMFSETFDLTEQLKERTSEILDASPIQVKGLVSAGEGEYVLHYTANVTLTVPSSRSLEPVELPLELSVNELFMTPDQFTGRDEEIEIPEEEILIIENNTIDLIASVVDNILLAIPLKVLTAEEEASNELPKGNDWEVITEDAYLEKQTAANETDPRLAKLSELFGEDSE